MWANPVSVSKKIVEMARKLDCCWIGAVQVDPAPGYDENNCHNNVLTHCAIYGGERVMGYYFVEGFNTIQAIRHSVWKNNDSLLDITPYSDRREYVIFGASASNNADYSISNCYSHSLAKYIDTRKQESEVMYYVYQLVDPQTEQPFYIGKGKGRRAKTHLWEIPETRNQYKENKIAAIRAQGLEPKIEYIAENIIDEQLAYIIEAALIAKYGRKGYEKDGILTNCCIDNRPPNHKGKTYEEIYGSEKAQQQRFLRSKLQKERGGYGPKKHTTKTKQLLSKIGTGSGNPMYGKRHTESTKQLISEKAKQRVGKLNKKSHKYCLTSPYGDNYTLYGGEAPIFCKENDLSWSTLKNQIQKGWGIPKKGKTKGWKLEVVND